jgi:hypothetical protein
MRYRTKCSENESFGERFLECAHFDRHNSSAQGDEQRRTISSSEMDLLHQALIDFIRNDKHEKLASMEFDFTEEK